ncbi:sialidase family protein [Streptomyces litchfieldiae]|uniref:exo-alpha-sialidase n=1 Tax=Streptomyces litchfieldiae TaxID=3075543 RepID=A0ABU2MSB0_9ACTN|nr:sialidase family protein [Streptomyces sp. DSM 44938]MDT0343494.1 sialidase family protein [Streptomyces sp. DSM 44938]
MIPAVRGRPWGVLVVVLGCLAAMVMSAQPARAAVPRHTETLLFDGGGESLNGVRYHSFRIPSLVRTTEDTLLAFAEGRVTSAADDGQNINLVYKRSENDGATWSPLMQVAGIGPGKWGNPTAVVDQDTGTIWLFLLWNDADYVRPTTCQTDPARWDDRRVYVTSSTDDGLTWAPPTDLTETLKPRTLANGCVWAHDIIGPGTGVQTSSGRLVVPALHRSIYSDNHGLTWQVERLADPSGDLLAEGTSEATVLELTDGRLYRNDRATPTFWSPADESTQRRWVTRGQIGTGFAPFAPDPALRDPRMEASVLRYTAAGTPRIMFLNSDDVDQRRHMRIRVSYDEAETWAISRPLSDAPLPGASTPGWEGLGAADVVEGGYSSMAKTADFFVGALVEVNENASAADREAAHRSIVFRKVNLPWILNGRAEPAP